MKKKNEINVDSHKKGYKEFLKIMNQCQKHSK